MKQGLSVIELSKAHKAHKGKLYKFYYFEVQTAELWKNL